MKTIKTQGVEIPRLGFGTFRMPGGDSQPVVESAIALGFRHIDTAAVYENEAAVGAAIAASGVKRDELFVTTKVWHDQLSPDALHRAFDISRGKLRLDYVDLYMIHWPQPGMHPAEMMQALRQPIESLGFRLRLVDVHGYPPVVSCERNPAIALAIMVHEREAVPALALLAAWRAASAGYGLPWRGMNFRHRRDRRPAHADCTTVRWRCQRR